MGDWTIDIAGQKAQHASGLTIIFEGVPETDYFAGSPRDYPKTTSPLQLSRLIREGFAEYLAAWTRAPQAGLANLETFEKQEYATD